MGEREGAAEPELTLRALIAGSLLGALLAAANVYTGLKTASIDGGSITASVLGVAIFRGARRRFGPLENNLTQTIAASAAVMAMTVGVLGPIPALAMTGFVASPWLLIAWGLALGALGVLVAALLRPQLISADGLPFPTGLATAEVIEAIASGAGSALRRAWALIAAALLAGVFGWLRDGPGWLPQAYMVPGAILGVPLATLSVGVSCSPLLLSTGLLIGARASGAMLLGSLLGWVGIAPVLIAHGIVADADKARDWLIWPGAALMLSSSLTSLALEWPAIQRGLRDFKHVRASGKSSLALVAGCVLALVIVARYAFQLGPLTTLLSLALALVLCVVCARSAGETDVAPVGAMGGVAQLVFGGSGTVASLSAGSVVAGTATQTAQTLWAFKTGDQLRASVRAQVLGALAGVTVGALVVVPTYAVLERAYGIGTAKMPAPGVMSWKATADAVQGGLSALPPHATTAALIGLVLGVGSTLLAHTRLGRFLISPVALGIGFLTPVAMGATVFLGGVLLTVLQRRWPTWTEEHVSSIAGGAIAGESLFAVVLAALIASGVLS
ncbi:MAG TPA: OPT family oligopeptide transporter [Polyangiales bacterium]|nr:OPT family oligopeptide transporter [Polyangiales bacterium]